MLEWLAASTGIELGKFVLEQVLDLSKPVLEGYVQDFFKDCLGGGVARLNAATLKTPMAEAVGYFVKRFVRELQINDVPDTSIEHHYKAAIKRFVKEKAVGAVLGEAFEKGCKQIDYAELESIWVEQYQVAGWQFPAEEFDWRGVGKEYVYEVKGIVKANAELRSLLEVELLEDIAQNTAQISPGFDLEKYRESLQSSYDHLKLYVLDKTDKVDEIKLWNMFIEPSAREAIPPTRYELPLDLKRKLQEEGQVEENLPREFLENYRKEYLQKPVRKVLRALTDSRHVVILGDPGAGKSCLLQYLALDWVEGKTEELPLLIELREYAVSDTKNFLDFLEFGKGADWRFGQKELHQYLQDERTLIMFDGLDEVFDSTTRSSVKDDIIRFSQEYEKARIIVTSRIIGYNPERFQYARFRHFTIQPFDIEEINEFIECWYNLTIVSDSRKYRFKKQLKDAIISSDAIKDLADNPLLLTMMAILNKRQDLPRNRVELYEQASQVLLYHWDVDYKSLNLSPDSIGRREKQEMLRLIAYEMQSSNEGLKTNLIGEGQLTQVLTNYLHSERFSEPREKAHQLIKQLQKRNFILCYRGLYSYGFIHRTFLEYFCALEFVNCFESQRSMSFEELRWQTFKLHWLNETWHEVLKLICNIIAPSFAENLVACLLDFNWLKDLRCYYYTGQVFEGKELIANLLLAADCLNDINKRSAVTNFANKLLEKLQKEVLVESHLYVFEQYSEVVQALMKAIATVWSGDPKVFSWFKQLLLNPPNSVIESAAINAIAMGWPHFTEAFNLIESKASPTNSENVQVAVIQSLSQGWKEDLQALQILFNVWVYPKIGNTDIRTSAVQALIQGWRNNETVFNLLKVMVIEDENIYVRVSIVEGLGQYWKSNQQVFVLLNELSESIGSLSVLHAAQIELDRLALGSYGGISKKIAMYALRRGEGDSLPERGRDIESLGEVN